MVQYRTPDYNEIISHSSMLTNERIDLVIKRLDLSIEQAWQNPCIPTITDYHAVTRNFFINVQAIIDDKDVKEISRILTDFYKAYYGALLRKELTLTEVYGMLHLLDRVNSLLRYNLQRLSYFFKMGKKGVQGTKDAIGVVRRGGGIFGGIPIKDERVHSHSSRSR